MIASVVQTSAEGKETVISTIKAPFACFISELKIANEADICVGAPVVKLSPEAPVDILSPTAKFDPTQISKEIPDEKMHTIMEGWIAKLDALAESQQPADNPMQDLSNGINIILDQRVSGADDSAMALSDGSSSTMIVATATSLQKSIAAHLAESKSLTIRGNLHLLAGWRKYCFLLPR